MNSARALDVFVEDVDGVGNCEAVEAGAVHEMPALNCFVVYGSDGSNLNIEYSEEWIGGDMTSSFVYTLYAKDFDGDGAVEILTGGRGIIPPDIYGEIDIWGFPPLPVGGEVAPFSALTLITPWIALAVTAIAIGYIINRRKPILH